ncbi:Ubiquitin carboxyl-terminal hydrolase [Phytophthora cinnamomi]|uniref:Ubiquitin carboxyl-terminal hydrolase n=1 Tax=Phytophthora cinnamomi TaxID=4785 RepID=UPI003559B535|nr:Ubiquitin carboxyl-terminal hydrolase [Phytophthora cinnamomi]
MTTASAMYMETVSLNDDAPAATPSAPASTVLDVDSLESQFAQPAVLKAPKDAASSPEIAVSVSDSDSDEDGNGQNKDVNVQVAGVQSGFQKHADDTVVVDVDLGGHSDGNSNGYGSQNGNQQQHVLPPLRVLTQKLPVEERDYVDTTLFSPEVSRHAMEVAHRRAKAIANEVKEMIELEGEVAGATKTKMSPAEAVGIIGGAFATSLQRAKKLVKPGAKEYDLLSGTSPSAGMSKLDDLDTDGDGLQLSPDAVHGDGKHFRTPKLRPALKRISAYSAAAALEPEKKTSSTRQQKKKNIQWHEDVLDADEEFYEDDSDELETHSLMNGDGDGMNNSNGSPRPQILNYSSKNDGQLTPRSKKKRKKLVRTMMRRLTPREKEELYRQRPDLMIVPNWAQKYREELAGEDSTRWNAWLLGLITVLAVLLLVFVVLIVRQRVAAST